MTRCWEPGCQCCHLLGGMHTNAHWCRYGSVVWLLQIASPTQCIVVVV